MVITAKDILAPLTIIVGHYGVGKTNFSLNLARDAQEEGVRTTLVDLDVVNPYFRSSDYTSMLEEYGIEVVAPMFAGTTLEVPSLSGKIDVAIGAVDTRDDSALIIDAGGDDVGATTLGRYAKAISQKPYRMLYVVNQYRNLTQQPTEAVAVMREIEVKSQLQVTGIVNNSHLQDETTRDTVEKSIAFAQEISEISGVPLVCTTMPNTCVDINAETETIKNVYPVKRYVRTSWDR